MRAARSVNCGALACSDRKPDVPNDDVESFFSGVSKPSSLANQHELPGSVISSQALREAALRASWYRDRRVARRREAWRWLVFLSWTCGRKSAVVLASLVALWWVGAQIQPDETFPLWARLRQWTNWAHATSTQTALKKASDAVPAAHQTPSRPLSARTPDTQLLPADAQNARGTPIGTPVPTGDPTLLPLHLKSEPLLLEPPSSPVQVFDSSTFPHPRKDLSP